MDRSAIPGILARAQEIEPICRKYKVQRLAVFGSVLRGDFRPDSDVDLLVEFRRDAEPGLFELVRMQGDLEALLGRKVDLLERRAIETSRNYLRRKAILDSAVPIYEEG
ncbi:MAG: nucleotidyltransferase family protein [Planctomycetota bacterium]